MIINFSVQNFGSIKDKQTLSFEADKSTHLEDYYVIHTNGLRLLKLGLIYGANASGKTTILKALDFLRMLVLNPKMQKAEIFDFEPFLFDENTDKENSIFEIEFLQNDVRYFYEVELNKKAIVREELYAYNPQKFNVFKRTTNLEHEFTEVYFGGKIKLNKVSQKSLEVNTLWNNTILGGFSKTNIELKELKGVTDWFNLYLNSLITDKTNLLDYVMSDKEDKRQKMFSVEILKKADFNISDVREKWSAILFNIVKNAHNKYNGKGKDKNLINEDITFEHYINNNTYQLDYKQESQGTQRYYGLAGILYRLIKDSVIFPIDELESSLHPDLFKHFLLSFLINSKKSQIIATTHNREILSNKDIFRNDAIWITDKDNDSCSTELYSLADFDTSVIRNTSSIYNAFKIGKLGGVPNLGDYFIDIEDEEK